MKFFEIGIPFLATNWPTY